MLSCSHPFIYVNSLLAFRYVLYPSCMLHEWTKTRTFQISHKKGEKKWNKLQIIMHKCTAAQVAWEGHCTGDSKNKNTRVDISVEDRLRLFHQKRDLNLNHDPFQARTDNFIFYSLYRTILPTMFVFSSNIISLHWSRFYYTVNTYNNKTYVNQ